MVSLKSVNDIEPSTVIRQRVIELLTTNMVLRNHISFDHSVMRYNVTAKNNEVQCVQ